MPLCLDAPPFSGSAALVVGQSPGPELDLGIPIVLSTDAFVCSYRPLDTIAAAVTRTTWQGQVLGNSERISSVLTFSPASGA